MKTREKGKMHIVEIVAGVGGKALYLDGHRIAGMKPWGGGLAVERFSVDASELRKALAAKGERTR